MMRVACIRIRLSYCRPNTASRETPRFFFETCVAVSLFRCTNRRSSVLFFTSVKETTTPRPPRVLQMIARARAALFLYTYELLDRIDTRKVGGSCCRHNAIVIYLQVSCLLLDDIDDANRSIPSCHCDLLCLLCSKGRRNGVRQVRRGEQ